MNNLCPNLSGAETFVIHYSLFTLRYSLFVIHSSLFTLRYSLFVIHYSLFTIRYSLFVIHSSLFTIRYSLFVLHYSLFTIHYSLLTLHCLHRYLPFNCRMWIITGQFEIFVFKTKNILYIRVNFHLRKRAEIT